MTNNRTNVRTPEHLALSSYIKYTEYAINALDRKLTKEEYSKLMESYVNGVPVKDAVNKLEEK